MHNINYYSYPEKVNKTKVFEELKNYVEHECWQEHGSLSNIRWNETEICESREAAEEWITKHDKGWYDCLAVRFKNPLPQETEKLQELRLNIRETCKEYQKRESELYSNKVTSAYIGCKSCGSKLSRTHLKTNKCPVCRAELRPEHMLKWVATAENKYRKAINTEKEYVLKHSKKEICWLVKIEYHT